MRRRTTLTTLVSAVSLAVVAGLAAPARAQFENSEVSGSGQPPLLMSKSSFVYEDLTAGNPDLTYNIYRRLPADQFRCIASSITTPSWAGDPMAPSAAVWWYTVTADDGWGENLHGSEIAIVERCPCGGPPPVSGTPGFALQQIASGLCQPTFVTAAPGDPSRLYVTEQWTGDVRLIRRGQLQPTPFLTLGTAVTTGNEQGLLSIAFHPQYASNGRIFVDYTTTGGGNAGRSVVEEYHATPYADTADPAPVRVIYTADQPYSNHNGGQIDFGPVDGFLYIAFGDGGSGDDPQNRAQNLGSAMGKYMRIDVDSAVPYAVPPDNPFLTTVGALPEIWGLGLRNHWRFSFDPANGDIYSGDVGQGCWEEINANANAPGLNYGWKPLEGFHCRGQGCGSSTLCATCPAVPNCATMTMPVVEYDHGQGNSVTGGYVYRGCRMPGHAGRYFYADYSSAFVRSFILSGGAATASLDHSGELTGISNVTSFGRDARGELYVVTRGSNNPATCSGRVWRIIPN